MKRLALVLLIMVTLALGSVALAQSGSDNSYGGWGPGMMGGGMMGPGMMGGGMMGPGMMGGGMMGPGMMNPQMLPFYNELTAEQRKQVDDLHLNTAQQMLLEGARVRGLMLALHQNMHRFPVDQAAARKTWDEIQKAQTTMFELMQGTMARMQQIVGKERWEQMQAFMSSGGMHGSGPGPGGMHRN